MYPLIYTSRSSFHPLGSLNIPSLLPSHRTARTNPPPLPLYVQAAHAMDIALATPSLGLTVSPALMSDLERPGVQIYRFDEDGAFYPRKMSGLGNGSLQVPVSQPVRSLRILRIFLFSYSSNLRHREPSTCPSPSPLVMYKRNSPPPIGPPLPPPSLQPQAPSPGS